MTKTASEISRLLLHDQNEVQLLVNLKWVVTDITNASDSSIQTKQKFYNKNPGREVGLANEILPFSENKNARNSCILAFFSTYGRNSRFDPDSVLRN